jgi:uncharacterized membrane protein YebE (DUF533 family)
MATLPNIPVNTATVIGGIAAMGLIAYQATLRTKIESQVHANYRDFKLIDAGVTPETTKLSVAQ